MIRIVIFAPIITPLFVLPANKDPIERLIMESVLRNVETMWFLTISSVMMVIWMLMMDAVANASNNPITVVPSSIQLRASSILPTVAISKVSNSVSSPNKKYRVAILSGSFSLLKNIKSLSGNLSTLSKVLSLFLSNIPSSMQALSLSGASIIVFYCKAVRFRQEFKGFYHNSTFKSCLSITNSYTIVR